MTPEEFKQQEQKLYDDCNGIAGEEGHINRDYLMEECLRSLGYGKGLDVLFSMEDIWYA